MQKEIWKPIKGYEGHYEVSSNGNVRSKKRNIDFVRLNKKGSRVCESVMFTPQKSKDGYSGVQLRGNGRPKTFKIHRLVAQAFIPMEDNRDCVNHINGIKTDNRVENLQWCTRSENTQHAYNTGLKKPIKGKHHYKAKKVINTVTNEVYSHLGQASEKCGYKYHTLANCLNGHRKNNTELMYLEDYDPHQSGI